jgi:predicted negative regulator of RcsB-dependent stress response
MASHHIILSSFILQAYICQGDAFLALNKFDLAEQSYLASLDIDPSIRNSKSFKVALNLSLQLFF